MQFLSFIRRVCYHGCIIFKHVIDLIVFSNEHSVTGIIITDCSPLYPLRNITATIRVSDSFTGQSN